MKDIIAKLSAIDNVSLSGNKQLNESADNTPYHRVAVTVSDPNDTMVSKRQETIQKFIRVKGDKEDACKKATEFYKKRGYKVHAAEYVEGYAIAQSVAESSDLTSISEGEGDVDPQFPDTEKGAIDAFKFMANDSFIKQLELNKCEVIPDPSVYGVWAIDSISSGERVIVYLKGYKEPFGDIRESNDFEHGGLPTSKVKELIRDNKVNKKLLNKWYKLGSIDGETLDKYLGFYKSQFEDVDTEDDMMIDEALLDSGDREYQTYNGWKSACRKAYPGCSFRGDMDIGAATLNGRDVGEWDGAVGLLYNAPAGATAVTETSDEDWNEDPYDLDDPAPMIEAKAPTLSSRIKDAVPTASQISKDKQGNYIFRKGYFYKSGMDSDKWAGIVKDMLEAAGLETVLIDKYDHWAPFKGGASTKASSHFAVIYKVYDPTESVVENDEESRLAFGQRDWDTEAEMHPGDGYRKYRAAGGKLSRSQWEFDNSQRNPWELDENARKNIKGKLTTEDTVADFVAKGGKIKTVPMAKPRKGEQPAGSKHIGGRGEAKTGSKGKLTGRGANTTVATNKPVVTADIHGGKIKKEVVEVVAEGVSFRVRDPKLAKILRRFPHEAQNFDMGSELDDDLYSALYDYYKVSGQLPYGIAKGRDDDPYDWISAKLRKEMTSPELAESEGISIDPEVQDILDKYPHEVKVFKDTGELEDISPLYDELFDHYCNNGDMPYGIAKARTGDPVAWVADKLDSILESNDELSLDESNSIDDEQYECDYCGRPVTGVNDPSEFRCCGEVGHVHMSTEQVDEDSFDPTPVVDDEKVLIENDNEKIADQLADIGLDEGLDFFFDGNTLVVIGRSTARAAINIVGGKITDIDGEEVRISLTPVEKVAPAAELDDTFDDADADDFSLPVTEGKVKELQQDLRSEKAGGLSDVEFKKQYKKTKEEARKALKENMTISIQADGEEDVLDLVRKLSGTPTVSTPTADIYSAIAAVNSIEDEVSPTDVYDEIAVDDIEESEECEYSNSPCPTTQSGTTSVIASQGNDPSRKVYTAGMTESVKRIARQYTGKKG